MGQHFNADVILLADLRSDRSGLASKAPALWRYQSGRGGSVRGDRQVIGFFRSLAPIASSKNTVVFYDEFCVIASKVGLHIGSIAYREWVLLIRDDAAVMISNKLARANQPRVEDRD